MISYSIYLSLTYFPKHNSLGPSMLLQIVIFHYFLWLVICILCVGGCIYKYINTHTHKCHTSSSHSLTVVLICISLMTNDVKHFFMGLLPIFRFSFKQCLLKPFANFLTGLPFCCWAVKSSLRILYTISLFDKWFVNIRSHSVLAFYFLDSILWCTEVLKLMKSNLPNFFLLLLALLVSYLRIYCQIQYMKIYSHIFLWVLWF